MKFVFLFFVSMISLTSFGQDLDCQKFNGDFIKDKIELLNSDWTAGLFKRSKRDLDRKALFEKLDRELYNYEEAILDHIPFKIKLSQVDNKRWNYRINIFDFDNYSEKESYKFNKEYIAGTYGSNKIVGPDILLEHLFDSVYFFLSF